MTKGQPHSDLIRTEGDPVLRAKALPVPLELFGSEALAKILTDMRKALRDEPYGVAIAAPQIGVSYRIFVVRGYILANLRRTDPGADALTDVAFINPTITYRSQKKVRIDGEGCLSVPNVYGTIERSVRVRLTAMDERGKKFVKTGSDLIAEIFEHECDHLDGILFIDNATDLHEGK